MIGNQERPLVTFALFAYNQERYIEEAVEAALSQDYSPLEIIISDDSSDDETFTIIQKVVAGYRGPHSVRLNRNLANLGIAEHINAVMEIVASEFVVVAAGDDISMPYRTRVLTEAWRKSGGKVLSVHSSAIEIDSSGNDTKNLHKGCQDFELNNAEIHASRNLFVLGATHGWDMSLIRLFEPLLGAVVNEDVVLAARAALLGRIQFIDRPLVRYRAGVGVSHENARRRQEGIFKVSTPLLKRTYYSFLQKHRDFRLRGLHVKFRGNFARARAESIFPIWLRNGHRSSRKTQFFLARCRWHFLFWEIVKFRIPVTVAMRRRFNYWIFNKLFRFK